MFTKEKVIFGGIFGAGLIAAAVVVWGFPEATSGQSSCDNLQEGQICPTMPNLGTVTVVGTQNPWAGGQGRVGNRDRMVKKAQAQAAGEPGVVLVGNGQSQTVTRINASQFPKGLGSLLLSASTPQEIPKTGFENFCKIQKNGLAICMQQIYVLGLGLGGLVALLMVVVAGYRYMTAAGNAQQTEKAKEAFTSAFIGLIILFIAFILLYLINPDLVQFKPLKLPTTKWR